MLYNPIRDHASRKKRYYEENEFTEEEMKKDMVDIISILIFIA